MAITARTKTIILITTGCLLIAIGGGLIPAFKRIIHDTITKKMPLKNGSESYGTWKDPPVPVYMEFWVFDIQNRDDIIHNKSKPILVQRGPYVYREVRPKSNITFHKNGTLSYRQPKTYHFDRELSAGDENDTFITINLLMITIIEKLESWPEIVQKIEDIFFELGQYELFAEQTVHDVIWGYDITILKKLEEFLKKYFPQVDMKIPYQIGLFAGQNGTDDGMYTIYTGAGNNELNKLNLVDRWNGKRHLDYWSTADCNMINGTDGTLYHPFVDKSATLYLFSTDICRSIYATYDSSLVTKSIPLNRFVPPPEVFADHHTNPANIGFCTPDCLGAGVLNISVCKGAPVIISQPHFYEAAQEYLDAVEGMHPNKEEHETFIDVEPNTGAVMNAAKRLQINIFVQNVTSIKETHSLIPVILPVAWVNETAKIDDSSADKFYSEVMMPILITLGVQYGLIALGLVILLSGIAYGSNKRVCRKARSGETERLISNVDPSEAVVNS